MENADKIEAILFVAGRPMSVHSVAKLLEVKKESVIDALPVLRQRFSADSGIMLVMNNEELQLVTNPAVSKTIAEFLKEEIAGPLTRPQLEALSVIAYCGPITKSGIEEIRGVNCSLILRNLMIRGLAQELEDIVTGEVKYAVTHDLIRHLGISGLEELPDYQKLRNNETVKAIIGYAKNEE